MAERKSTSLAEEVRGNLEELCRCALLAQASVIVTIQALKHQDAEQDRDIASVLEHTAGDQLDKLIEGMEAMVAKLAKGEGPREYRVEEPPARYGVQ